tara:strand:+ start:467 stop:1306 length:840 start_codon:yes stop_codon:yes gene_type:complete
MKINDLKKQLKKIDDLKKNNSFDTYTLKELKTLPTFNGLCELSFKNIPFYMINISNDDAVPLKYLWRNKYEHLSLSLWYKMTRKDGYFFDVGAHTGIYSIIGNLNKKENSIISIEAYFLNFSRLLSNLKINNIMPKSCFLAAVSNTEGAGKFSIKTGPHYHSSGGKISENGNLNVSKIKIDNFKLDKKINGIKIDTEGHEFEVLEGAQNYISKDKPDIIFEINENCFDNCLELLKPSGYFFYFIDEIDERITKIDKFSPSLKKAEGTNCYATVNQTINY